MGLRAREVRHTVGVVQAAGHGPGDDLHRPGAGDAGVRLRRGRRLGCGCRGGLDLGLGLGLDGGFGGRLGFGPRFGRELRLRLRLDGPQAQGGDPGVGLLVLRVRDVRPRGGGRQVGALVPFVVRVGPGRRHLPPLRQLGRRAGGLRRGPAERGLGGSGVLRHGGAAHQGRRRARFDRRARPGDGHGHRRGRVFPRRHGRVHGVGRGSGLGRGAVHRVGRGGGRRQGRGCRHRRRGGLGRRGGRGGGRRRGCGVRRPDRHRGGQRRHSEGARGRGGARGEHRYLRHANSRRQVSGPG